MANGRVCYTCSGPTTDRSRPPVCQRCRAANDLREANDFDEPEPITAPMNSHPFDCLCRDCIGDLLPKKVG